MNKAMIRRLTTFRESLLDYTIWPALLVLSLGGVVIGLRAGISPGLVLFAQSVLNILVIAGLETLRPARPEWALHDDRALLGDLVHSLLGSVAAGSLGRALLNSGLALLAAALSSTARGSVGPAFMEWPIAHWHPALQFAVFLLYVELVGYWYHRSMHSLPVLWRFHFIHHNPERMHVLKSGRVHWLTGIFGVFLKYVLPVALAAPPECFVAYAAATNIFGTTTHANFRHRVPHFVHYVLNTAGVHHLHHSTDLDPGNSNFGNIVSVWDLVFRSFRHPDNLPLAEVGVDHPVLAQGLAAELLGPVLAPFWPGLFAPEREPAASPTRAPVYD